MWVSRLATQLLQDAKIPQGCSAHSLIGDTMKEYDPIQVEVLLVHLVEDEGNFSENIAILRVGIIEARSINKMDNPTCVQLEVIPIRATRT